MLLPIDVTANWQQQQQSAAVSFLCGRIVAPARPLCVFDRPGVLLRLLEDGGNDEDDDDSDRLRPFAAVLLDARIAKSLMMMKTPAAHLNGQPAAGMQLESDKLRAAMGSILAAKTVLGKNNDEAVDDGSAMDGALFYTALRWRRHDGTNHLVEADPSTVWDSVVPPDTQLLVDACGLAADEEEAVMHFFELSSSAGTHAPPAGSLLLCTLDSQGAPENLPHDCIFVRARRRGGRNDLHQQQEELLQQQHNGFNNAGGILSEQDDDGECEAFAVRIGRVVHISERNALALRGDRLAAACRGAAVFRSVRLAPAPQQ